MGFTNPYPAGRLTVDSTNSLGTGLLLWAPLTEGTGTTADCIVHAGHTGTQSGGVSWASDSIGTVASFDGVDDYFDFGTFSSYFPGPSITGSISGWVKWNSGRTIPIGGQATSNERLYIGVTNGNWDVGFGNYPWNNNYTGTLVAAVSGEWAHLVMSISSGVAKLYVNGSETITKTADTSVSLGGQFSIGAYIGPSGINANHTDPCEIQNVRIYDRALSATEVATLYHRPWEGSNYGDIWPYSPPASTAMTLSTDTAATSIMADIEGWWVMTDGSGTTLKDISGNGRDATLYGTNTWVSDSLGTANRFDNSSSNGNNARTADTQPDLSSGYTVAFWIKHEELGAGTNRYGGGLALTDGAGTGTWWQTISSDIEIYFNSFFSNSQHPQLVHNRANGGIQSSYNRTQSQKAVQNNVWHFWVVAFDGTNARVYQDASLVGTSGTLSVPLSTTGKHIVINGAADAATGLTCSMQNVRFYSRCLSSDEISLLYERPWEGIEYGDTFHYDPPAPASMLPLTSDAINTNQEAWWPLTQTTGSTCTDISGNSLDGTQNGTEVWQNSELGYVHESSGTSQNYFDNCGSTSDFAFAHTTGIMTISCWIRPTATGRSFILANNDTSGANGFFFDRKNGNGMNFYMGTSGVGGGTSVSTANGTAPSDGSWQHWVFVLDTGNTVAQFYKNGVAVTTTGTIAGTGTGSTRYTTALGGLSSVPSETFDGDLQNIRVWSRVLTADEIWSIYSNPWLGSNYKLASGSTPLYNYIFRTERFRRLG